jgi:hypothetical protein
MIHRQDMPDELPEALAAPRALVFLTVPWSCPERTARAAFHAAASRLTWEYSDLGITFFSLDGEADPVQTWLAALRIDCLGTGPCGAGSMLWLEEGTLVSSEIGGANMSANDIVARSLRLWRPGV